MRVKVHQMANIFAARRNPWRQGMYRVQMILFICLMLNRIGENNKWPVKKESKMNKRFNNSNYLSIFMFVLQSNALLILARLFTLQGWHMSTFRQMPIITCLYKAENPLNICQKFSCFASTRVKCFNGITWCLG